MKVSQQFVLAAGCCLAGLQAFSATVSKVVAWQNWPWSADVRIEYMLSGLQAGEMVDLTVTATDEGKEIKIPAHAITGECSHIVENGQYTLTVNPLKIPELVAKKGSSDLRFSLSADESPIYMVLDLPTSNVTYLTKSEILASNKIDNVRYAVDTNLNWISNSTVKSDTVNSPLIWTGVTNDAYYATDAIVLRRIPAGTVRLRNTRDVTLSKDFWIGVFEVTQEQYRKITGLMPSAFFIERNRRPVEKISYSILRESSDNNPAPAFGWPTNSTPEHPAVCDASFMGKIRSRFPDFLFDLPTEAQWEYVCRAGTSGSTWNNGASSGSEPLTLGRYKENGGQVGGTVANTGVGPTNGTAIVGSYLPNAWGIYDMHGNVNEWTLDAYDPLPVGTFVDYIGSSSSTNRVTKGGNWWGSWTSCGSANATSSKSFNVGSSDGFRLAIPHFRK